MNSKLTNVYKKVRAKNNHLFLLLAGAIFFASCSASKKTVVSTPAKNENTHVAINDPVKPAPVIPEPAKPVEKPVDNTFAPLQEKYAGILSAKPEEISNHNLYELINQWDDGKTHYNTDYPHIDYAVTPEKIPSREVGIDCSGFAEYLLYSVYGKTNGGHGSAADLFTHCKKISNDQLQEGDLVFFNHTKSNDSSETISHVGVYLKNRKFVNSTNAKGVIISSLDDPYYWKQRFVCSGRLTDHEISSNPIPLPVTDTTSASPVNAIFGKASYYADDREGKKTASGDTFSQSKLTAATSQTFLSEHKIKYGAKVRVTNMRNNKSVIVTLNDIMGSKVHIVDLTTSAAKEIDMIREGVANVKIEILE